MKIYTILARVKNRWQAILRLIFIKKSYSERVGSCYGLRERDANKLQKVKFILSTLTQYAYSYTHWATYYLSFDESEKKKVPRTASASTLSLGIRIVKASAFLSFWWIITVVLNHLATSTIQRAGCNLFLMVAKPNVHNDKSKTNV